MGRIYSHSSLEKGVCEAAFADSMLTRYSKAGPALQGTAGHRWLELYLRHLVANKTDSDRLHGAALWDGMRAQMPADDERRLDYVIQRLVDASYAWLTASSEPVGIEIVQFWTLERRPLTAEEAAHWPGPLFRTTKDLDWHGDGPRATGTQMHNVLDWKFHQVIEHVRAPAVNRQLLRYVAPMGGEEAVRVWLGFPRHSYFEDAIVTAEERNDAWQNLVVRPILLFEEMYARGERFEHRTVGAHCRDCDLRRGCPAAERYPADVASLDGATPAQVMAAAMIADEFAGDLKARLRVMVGSMPSGALEDGDFEARLDDSDRLTYRRTHVLKVLSDYLPDDMIEEAFTATKTRIEKVLKSASIKKSARLAIFELLAEQAEVQKVTTLKTTKKHHAREEQAPVEEDVRVDDAPIDV